LEGSLWCQEESVTLIQPQYKGDGLKEKAKGHCLNYRDVQEFVLTVPFNRRGLIHALKSQPKADIRCGSGEAPQLEQTMIIDQNQENFCAFFIPVSGGRFPS